MRRFLLLWVVLAVALLVVTTLVSGLAFRHIDLRYHTFLHLLIVPTAQAIVLLWVSRQIRLRRVVPAVKQITSHRAVAAFLAADVAFLLAGWLARTHPLLGIAGVSSLHPTWRAVKAVAAGLLIGVLACRRGWSAGERSRLVVVAFVATALGADAFAPWLKPLPRLLLPHLPTILRWAVVYGALFAATIVALLAAGTVLGRRSPVAKSLIGTAAGLGFSVALMAVAHVYLRPILQEPWAGIALSALSLAATLTLAGVALGWRPPPTETRQDSSET